MKKPPVYCVFGRPIAHSLSPALHRRLLAEAGQDGTYEAIEEDDAARAVPAVRDRSIAGASVTLPLKIDMLDVVDIVDPSAEAVGAINTLLWRDGKLVGANTDVDGVRASLRMLSVELSGRSALLVGTGGAARVAAHVLHSEGADVLISSRSAEKGEAFVRAIGFGRNVTGLEGVQESVDLLVNATPVGMWPNVNETILEAGELSRVGAVLDLVYNPDPTRLVREATERGLPALGGTEMFAVQAARQFELWTGISPDLDFVRKTVRELLEERR